VKRQLDGKDIENFLPLYEKLSQWRNGKRKIHLPLFPGYLFVKILPRERIEVLKVFGAINIVGDGHTPRPIPEDQIAGVQRFVEKGLKFDPYPYLKTGDKVRITGGPLEGLEGILQRKKNRALLVVSVDLIQRSVSVEVESWKIERI
jgi:transcription antitermination factor NusG